MKRVGFIKTIVAAGLILALPFQDAVAKSKKSVSGFFNGMAPAGEGFTQFNPGWGFGIGLEYLSDKGLGLRFKGDYIKSGGDIMGTSRRRIGPDEIEGQTDSLLVYSGDLGVRVGNDVYVYAGLSFIGTNTVFIAINTGREGYLYKTGENVSGAGWHAGLGIEKYFKGVGSNSGRDSADIGGFLEAYYKSTFDRRFSSPGANAGLRVRF